MPNGSNFLTIPSQEALLGAGEEEEEEDDEDEDQDEPHRLVPRSSPVPRKRGDSVAYEAAEYMRTGLSLSSRRVSFADTAGARLVEVKEFAAFESDEEEEEDEEDVDRREGGAALTAQADFQSPPRQELLQAVRRRRVEVESVARAEGDPLAVTGLVRVLNVCFHKQVYVRFSGDSWRSHREIAAQYVHGSNDGETDGFAFTLTFSPACAQPGARLEFVVRLETPDGHFWANNGGRNYAVVLMVSRQRDAGARKVEERSVKGILKAPTNRTNTQHRETEAQDAEQECSTAELQQRLTACPQIVHPELDIEESDALDSSAADKSNRKILLAEMFPLTTTTDNEKPLSPSSPVKRKKLSASKQAVAEGFVTHMQETLTFTKDVLTTKAEKSDLLGSRRVCSELFPSVLDPTIDYDPLTVVIGVKNSQEKESCPARNMDNKAGPRHDAGGEEVLLLPSPALDLQQDQDTQHEVMDVESSNIIKKGLHTSVRSQWAETRSLSEITGESRGPTAFIESIDFKGELTESTDITGELKESSDIIKSTNITKKIIQPRVIIEAVDVTGDLTESADIMESIDTTKTVAEPLNIRESTDITSQPTESTDITEEFPKSTDRVVISRDTTYKIAESLIPVGQVLSSACFNVVPSDVRCVQLKVEARVNLVEGLNKLEKRTQSTVALQTEDTLGSALVASFVLFSLVVCMLMSYWQPGVLLVIGLFLILLCF